MYWKTCCCETGYAHTFTTRGISFNVCVWHPHNINVIHKFALLNIVYEYDCLCPVQQLSLGPDRVVAKTDTQHSLASVSRAAPEVLASYKLRVIAPTLFSWLLGFPNTHSYTQERTHNNDKHHGPPWHFRCSPLALCIGIGKFLCCYCCCCCYCCYWNSQCAALVLELVLVCIANSFAPNA